MDSEQWKQLDKLLHAALERPPEERDAFLRHACGGDERLEREARSLLTLERKAEGFLERPAIQMAAHGGFLAVPPDAVVVDLGANIGNFTSLALAHGPRVRVIAVEPSRPLVESLQQSANRNGWADRVACIRAFIGGRTEVQARIEDTPDYAGALSIAQDSASGA